MPDEWMPLADAAQRLGVSWERAWRLLLSGSIAGEKRSGRWWVKTADVDRTREILAKQAAIPA